MALKIKINPAVNPAVNPQDTLINSIEGIHLVDAGAGTGKTYSIVKRYEKIIEKSVKPENILLVTFTNSAAEEMRQKVINKLSDRVGISKLLEAPIMTFHSFCSRILKKAGTNSPAYLGLNEYLPGNFNIIEESSFEIEIFRRFFLTFAKVNGKKYSNIFYSLENEHEVILQIIKKLCSVGIFPAAKGWKEEDAEKLKGNYKLYSEYFDRLNETVMGKTKEIQNDLFKRFNGASKDKLYTDFNAENIFVGNVSVNPEIKEELFNDGSQEEFLEFMNDVYISYIEYLLKRNQINYEFMIMFAYLVLYNNKVVRNSNQFEYLMVDEFQDTDEIQFKLIMLVCKNNNGNANLCVVGDWKQGIYGFRNSQIDNITEFSLKLKLYKIELNTAEVRIEYDVSDFNKIIFENNYRSSESILNFSRKTLFVKGGKEEEVDTEFVELNFEKVLLPERKLDDITEIEFYKAEDRLDEYQLVLKKISELVNEKDKYKIRIFDSSTGDVMEERAVKYSDICVLSRKTKFCLELQREGLKAGIPVNYSGGLEIFSSEQGILVLAWLKLILNEKDIFGWLPVLDKEGFTYPEIKYFKKNYLEKNISANKLFSEIPDELNKFLKRIRLYRNNILYGVEAILSRYKYHDEIGNKIISVLQQWNESDLISLNELVQTIENSACSLFDVELGNSSDAVLTQTIHKSKGLEYPIVILANVNDKSFPSTKGESGKIIYNSVTGLRLRTFFGTNGKYYFKYNNWRSDLLGTIAKKSDKDEERRLLYVAVTRAKQYLYITAFKPSYFFTGLAEISVKETINDFEYETIKSESENNYTDTGIKLESRPENIKKFISPHNLMEEVKDENENDFSKMKKNSSFTDKNKFEFGLMIHNIANKIANGIEIESEIKEVNRIKKFIIELKANELKSEVDFLYPEKEKIIRGTIDLLAFYDDRIEVIDYKTDSDKIFLEKYKIQIGVYRDVIKSIYKNKEVIAKIYFVGLDEVIIV